MTETTGPNNGTETTRPLQRDRDDGTMTRRYVDVYCVNRKKRLLIRIQHVKLVNRTQIAKIMSFLPCTIQSDNGIQTINCYICNDIDFRFVISIFNLVAVHSKGS